MKHYFTDNTDLDSKQTTFTYNYQDSDILFTSDLGVFSKTMIDYGSRAMLETIEITSKIKTILDVGCGYGTFGISLKMVNPQLIVDMIDVNDRALQLCELNARNNNLTDINIYKSNIYQNVSKNFDLIITNPPIRAGKEVVHKILEDSYSHLNTDGELWVVIQKKQGAPSAKDKMTKVFNNCEVVKRDKGYYILVSKK